MDTFRQALGNMQRAMEENLVVVRRIEARSRVPRELGCPWEVCDHQPLVLDDILGRKLLVPYELSSEWEVSNLLRLITLKSLSWLSLKRFQDYLKLAFQDLPGSLLIHLGNFYIRNGDHEILGPGNWQHNVKPNMKLIMSIKVTSTAQSPQECPRCTAPHRGYTPAAESGHVQWCVY